VVDIEPVRSCFLVGRRHLGCLFDTRTGRILESFIRGLKLKITVRLVIKELFDIIGVQFYAGIIVFSIFRKLDFTILLHINLLQLLV